MANAIVHAGPFGPTSTTTTAAGDRLAVLPTGQADNRQFMRSLCITDEENRLAARPSHDIVVSLPAGTNSQYWAVNVIRRDDYFRALLPESRGRVQATPSICPPALKSIGFEECINVARQTGWPAPDGFEHGSING